MYCSKCGEKVEDVAFCPKCGTAINSATDQEKTNTVQEKTETVNVEKPKKGKGIASMVLGIIAVYFSLSALFNLSTSLEVYEYYEYYGDYEGAFSFGFAIGYILIQAIFAIISICLASSERKNNKNGFNSAGLWLSISTFAIAALTFFIIMAR